MINVSAKTDPATATYKDFTYSVNGKSVTIIKYNGSAKSVTIPATIDGKKVTKIGRKSFRKNKEIEKVNTGKNVTTIGESTFAYCRKIKKVVFGKKVKTIGENAFQGCKKLTSIKLPSKLTRINYGVFSFTGLTSIEMGKDIKYINSMGLDINSLKKITVKKSNEHFSSKAGVLYDKKQTKLLFCPRAIEKKELTIPKTVKLIDCFAFEMNKTLKNIILPKKLKTICQCAFLGCKKLKRITIPKSVTLIDDFAFSKSCIIKGYKNSEAEVYAKEYGLKFVKIG